MMVSGMDVGRRIKNSEVTIIIPVKDEEEAIGLVIDEVRKAGYENILVVDGHSRDRTVEIALSKGVEVIVQPGKGKADAIRAGIEYVKTKYVVIMDGDYTYPAEYIPKLIEKAMKGYDEVIGARVKGRENIPFINRVGNWLLTKMFNLLFDTNLRDVLSGMYILNLETLNGIEWETKGFSIESEIAAHVASQTGRITEIPIKYRKRLGKAKLGIKHGLFIGKDIINLAWRYNPAFFIFSLGGLLLIPGLLLGGYVAYHYFFTGVKYYVKGLVAIMLTSTGLTSIIMAILALFVKRVERRIIRRVAQLEKMLGNHAPQT